MSSKRISPQLLDKLRAVDTPTVCNAIEVAQGKRGFQQFARGTMIHSRPGVPAMVGFARTAIISGSAPPQEDDAAIKARRLAYYEHMAQASDSDLPRVAVIEDSDHPHPIAGWWGEINVAIHKGLGLSGAITNGVVRDLDVLDDGFQVLAGSIGVSHAFVHVTQVAGPVTVRGLRVNPDDLVHADRHGALVIPPEVLPTLAEAIDKLLRGESLILDAARREDFDIEKLKVAWTEFERART